jgi:hypothetical protein
MNLPTSSSLLACAALVAGIAVSRVPASARASARYVPAEIRVDGVTVLRASTSDDGSPDADAVWDYQRATLAYEETEAFAEARKGTAVVVREVDGARECILQSPEVVDEDGKQQRRKPIVEVDVSYGGRARVFEARLVERKSADGRAHWLLAVEAVERMFSHREISRREASLLADPERTR